MFVIVGMLVVLGGVFGGYLMEHGNISVLIQPAELVIIGGAAMGALLISSPPQGIEAHCQGDWKDLRRRRSQS